MRKLNSGPSKLPREKRIEEWVKTASRGHNGVRDTRRAPDYTGRVYYSVEPDTRTPLERFRAMREQGKRVGVFLDDALAGEIMARLPAESIMPKDDNRGR